jgi:hypothetical protein
MDTLHTIGETKLPQAWFIILTASYISQQDSRIEKIFSFYLRIGSVVNKRQKFQILLARIKRLKNQ